MRAISVGNGQMCNITMKEIANALDCMHDQQTVLLTGGGENQWKNLMNLSARAAKRDTTA